MSEVSFTGSIILQLENTMSTTGETNVLDSSPHPPNGIVELDYEHTHIFK